MNRVIDVEDLFQIQNHSKHFFLNNCVYILFETIDKMFHNLPDFLIKYVAI